MKIDVSAVRRCLKAFDFATLFREHLGWDRHHGTIDIVIGGDTFSLTAVAQKRGFSAYTCPTIPDRATRLRIDHQVTKSAREHFVIYADQAVGQQVWQWVRREPGRPLASRDHRFDAAQSGDHLIQRLEQIAISIEEEEQLTLFEVTDMTKAAFDVETVTKKFYDRFKSEHAAFLKLISGVKNQGDLQWYTSLMLNRLMFVYFIQKKGFLDGDANYLQNRMRMIREAQGRDKFQTFYRYFLLRLFHDGLGKLPAERKLNRDLEQLLGRVPYLNGGFFEVHEIEERNTDIDIPDKAFQKLFAFFDDFRWHLDERPLRANNEINPDVVGYIFEKYINQRELGAYYTKEDITGYISKNTIIPFVFNAAEVKCPIAFSADGFLWRMLRDAPERYIYPAMRHGVIDDQGRVVPCPKEIAVGLDDVSERGDWNKTAAEPFGVPTETWREYAARRTRCLALRKRIADGEVHLVSDLVTLNLDIWQFARDAIVNSEGPELLRAFWDSIQNVTVLDPTCGSGAFLFAALRILESLYSDCLERMERFVEDLVGKEHHPEQFSDFREVLAQIAHHPNERYFVLKSIIINNLFGVDIMEEAIEICKLRLFLKLVAQVETAEQIEPLPDIDFNVRAGNTLVGYTSLEQVRESQKGTLGFGSAEMKQIEKDALGVERAFQHFRAQQTKHGGKVTAREKQDLRDQLAKLDNKLDRYLAGEYGVSPETFSADSSYKEAFEKWKVDYRPFHWFVEFYGIMQAGGFDVLIGNPPYLELRQVDYTPRHLKTVGSSAVHAMCIERSISLRNKCGAISMIVPLALVSTQRMTVVQSLIEEDSAVWYSNFAWRPGKLFDTVNRALTIFVSSHGKLRSSFSTDYQKWNSDTRAYLIPKMTYCRVPRRRPSFWVPKLGDSLEQGILAKLLGVSNRMSDFVSKSAHLIYYRTTGGLYWKVFTDFAPAFRCNGKAGKSSRQTTIGVVKASYVKPAIALLSSDLFWWWYTITSNLRDLNPSDIQGFPVSEQILNDTEMRELGAEYLRDLKDNSTMLVRHQKQTGKTETQCFKIQRSKPVIEGIDRRLAVLYGLDSAETDFIINYDIKYRMGAEENEADE